MSDEKMLSDTVGKGRTHGTSETSNKKIRKEKILKKLKQNRKTLKPGILGEHRLIKEETITMLGALRLITEKNNENWNVGGASHNYNKTLKKIEKLDTT